MIFHKPPALFFAIAALATGCANHYPNLEGHHFILKEDCYAYHYKGQQNGLLLGCPTTDPSLRPGSPSILLDGKVPKGSTFTVKKAVRKHRTGNTFYQSSARLETVGGQILIVDVAPIMNTLKNPPVLDSQVAAEVESK
jgi:hypothetical protein